MKILIVDDEPLVRKSLGRACRSRGHEVLEAVDGKEGLRMWIESTPDLVFLDVLMPGLSGPEVLAEVDRLEVGRSKKGMRSSRVILMSAYAGEHELGRSKGGLRNGKAGVEGADESADESGNYDEKQVDGRSSASGGRFGEDLFIPKPFENVFEIVDIAEALIVRTGDAK